MHRHILYPNTSTQPQDQFNLNPDKRKSMHDLVELVLVDGNEQKTDKGYDKANVSHDEDDGEHVALLCVVDDGWKQVHKG